MNHKELVTKTLHYFRFVRRFLYIATECGPFNSDILIADGKQILEVEIKTSKTDLLKDFLKKVNKRRSKYKLKHDYYKEEGKHTPNQFLFAIPEELLPTALEVVEPYGYGVIVVSKNPLTINKTKNRKKINYCSIVKRPKQLTNSYSKTMEHIILLRMGSELIRTRLILKDFTQMKRIALKVNQLLENKWKK